MNHTLVRQCIRAMPLFCWLLLLSIIAGGEATAATYYVKNGGNNALDGLSDATAWATLSKVNGTAFAPGDQVLFRRGDTWTATAGVFFRPGTSAGGAEGNPIVFGAYGEGPKPVFDGNLIANPCIRLQGRHYLVLQDFTVKRSVAGSSPGISIETSSFITLLRMDVSDTSGVGISTTTSTHVLIDGCTVLRAGNNGILFNGSTGLPHVSDCTVQNCFVGDTQGNDGIVIHEGAQNAQAPAGANFIFRNNVVAGPGDVGKGEQGFDITTGSHVLLEDNETYANRAGAIVVGHSASDVTIRRHYSHGEPAHDTAGSLVISAPDVTVEYSKFIGIDNLNKPLVRISKGDQQPENVRLLNNTFVWDHPGGGTAFQFVAGAQPANFTMKNNVFVSRTSGNITFNFQELQRPPSYAGFDIDNNLYWAGAAGAMRWSVGSASSVDFATYRGTYARDLNGFEADPQFADLGGGDFHLQITSPAVDAGAVVALSQSVDFDGTPVPQGSAPDIGAFESVPAPLAAVVRHAPVLNGGVDGAVQVLLPEGIALNGNAWISRDLLVPGTPTVRANGQPDFVGIIDRAGAGAPANYAVTLNGRATLRYVIRRVDAVELPVVDAPPAPAGTRDVVLDHAGEDVGDFAAVRNLTLNGNAGLVAVPAGTYGALTANGGGGFVLGVAGATTPAVYNVQRLAVNGNSRIEIAGPVTLVLAQGSSINGTVGDSEHAAWLTLEIADGGLTLNGSAALSGSVIAPRGTVTINGNSTVTGAVSCDRLVMNGGGLLRTGGQE